MNSQNTWMVRSDGGNALSLFEEGVVGIHYGISEDLTGKSLDAIRALYTQYNPGTTKNKAGGPVGMLDRIANVMQVGDGVVTYDPGTRQYWLGKIAGPYFSPKNTTIGAPEVRSFIGALRAGDRGIYLSTGGFTREARYESDRATVPVSLMDLDDLARLIETHYEAFDTEGRALLPLTKVYWPAD